MRFVRFALDIYLFNNIKWNCTYLLKERKKIRIDLKAISLFYCNITIGIKIIVVNNKMQIMFAEISGKRINI